MNTWCAELSKFVICESSLTVFCDYPKHVLCQSGNDFLRMVPTTWEDTRFVDGYPEEFVVLVKRSGKERFLGAMNNDATRTVTIPTDFLPAGKYELEYWEDVKDAGKNPVKLRKNAW